jgi:hypothetical protein
MRLFLATLLAVPAAVLAAEDDAAFFRDKIRPIFAETCFQCHSHESGKSKGNLLLDSRAAVLTGGDTGPAIVPGKPDQSLLIKAVRYDDEDLQMPPKKGDLKKLSDAQIAALTEWVKRGAPWPEEAGGQKMVARARGVITDEDRKWWAIQPVANPQPPKVEDRGWGKGAVDAFLFQKLSEAGLAPAPPANAEQLCRRIYFDLIGLPPTPAETAVFVRDEKQGRQAAIEALADKLLASPRYGERWARHWLDLVRYAESDGYKADDYRETAWRYRDYVVNALNADKPYNRFVQEQLAGDELFPGDVEARTATSFLRCGIYEYNNRDVAGQWDGILNDLTDVAGDVFMGVGVGCARCHDHKFDPVLQKDYFRLRAFFAPIRWTDTLDVANAADRAAYAEKLAAWETKTADLRKQIAVIEDKARANAEKSAISKYPEEIQEIMHKTATERTPYEQQIYELAFRQVEYEWAHLLNHVKGEEKDRLIRLQKQLAAFDKEKPEALPTVLAATDIGPAASPIRIPKRDQLGDIAPGVLTILNEAPAKVTPLAQSTGRRSALAQWLTQPENPLTARVIVNRVWQYHFGRGLAANTSDFGRLGGPPSHPELLDWLTRRFVAEGWSLKKLHKLIVTSAAYQQGSASPLADKAKLTDPENKLLWRFASRRLDAEQVRDAVLATTGELDLKFGGPSVTTDRPRRTIDTRVMRNTRDSLLEGFDPAEGFQSTAQRNSTTTSTQALTMFNGPWLLARAKALADRVTRDSSSDLGERALAAMRLAWNREPTEREVAAAKKFIEAQAALIEARPAEMKPLALTTEKMPFREGKGVVLTPGGVERLFMRNSPSFPDGDFTIEAFVMLRSLYDSGDVRTIASHWTGDKKDPGWAFGVTGRQSRYKAQTLLLQLNGEGAPANEAEPIFSGLILEIGKPYYVAVSVRLADLASGVTFYAKDLSNDDLPIQVATMVHTTHSGVRGTGDFILGGRGAEKGSRWDGLIDDVRLSRAALPAEALLFNSGQSIADSTVGYWRFESGDGLYKDSSPRSNDIQAKIVQAKPADPRAAAFVDFCHVLLNSNEFLYVD